MSAIQLSVSWPISCVALQDARLQMERPTSAADELSSLSSNSLWGIVVRKRNVLGDYREIERARENSNRHVLQIVFEIAVQKFIVLKNNAFITTLTKKKKREVIVDSRNAENTPRFFFSF